MSTSDKNDVDAQEIPLDQLSEIDGGASGGNQVVTGPDKSRQRNRAVTGPDKSRQRNSAVGVSPGDHRSKAAGIHPGNGG